MVRIVALSGPVAAGKSTLAAALASRYGAEVVRTHEYLEAEAQRRLKSPLAERRRLQEFGEQLDEETAGRWVVDMVKSFLGTQDHDALLVVDAVRLSKQVEALRTEFGRRVVHVHVHADPNELAIRYARKSGGIVELASYGLVQENATEANIGSLGAKADVSIDTVLNSQHDVAVRAAARLGLLPKPGERLVDVLVGGQYGSEGKGNIAYYLAPEYDLLVRVGGPNAGHKVPSDPPMTHRSLPSGTLANPQCKLLIGPGAVIHVETLLDEIEQARMDPSRLAIDPQVMIISDEDRRSEGAIVEAIGSTGQGVGAATARRILSRDVAPVLAKDVSELQGYIHESGDVLDDAFSQGHRILLEGTQGTSLSLFHGSYPHVTSRDTTTSGCLAEAGINPRRVRRVVMVCRAYPIRVGGPSGPISQQISWDLVAARAELPLERVLKVEVGSVTNKQRRVGEFDWSQLHRAAELNGATDVALTFADYHRPQNQDAYRFDQLHPETIEFIEEIEVVTGSPVSLIANRFSQRSVIDRRSWRGPTG